MDHNFPVKRTREEGHTARCLAKALITATENLRDSLTSDYDRIMARSADDATLASEFRSMVQSGVTLEWAEEYLATGTTECICPELPFQTHA